MGCFTGGLSASLCKQEVVVFSVQSQIRQQEEVEKKNEVAIEMSDLVVYCQPRSKEKDRFGKHTQTHLLKTKIKDDATRAQQTLPQLLSGNVLQCKHLV